MQDHRSRHHRIAAVLVAVLAATLLGGVAAARQGYTSDQSVVQIVSTNVQGKNVYIPSTIVVVAGEPTTLSVFNTTDVPHGFSIGGLGIQEVLPPQQEHEVKLPKLEGGRVYRVHCQLHAAHRTATLVVLPAAP